MRATRRLSLRWIALLTAAAAVTPLAVRAQDSPDDEEWPTEPSSMTETSPAAETPPPATPQTPAPAADTTPAEADTSTMAATPPESTAPSSAAEPPPASAPQSATVATPPSPMAPIELDRPRWIEAEHLAGLTGPGARTNFPSTKQNAALFGGAALVVDEAALPPAVAAYDVVIPVRVPAPTDISIWIAGKPPGRDTPKENGTDARWVSPIDVEMGGQTARVTAETHPVAAWYADGAAALYRAATITAQPGGSELRLRITIPRQRDDHYAAELDAILFVPEAWQPDTSAMPSWSAQDWLTYVASARKTVELDLDGLLASAQAVAAQPTAATWLAFAETLEREDLPAAAMTAYRQTLARDPNNVPALTKLAELAQAAGQLHEAADLYGQLAALRPEDRATQQLFADALEAAEDLDGAAHVYEQLLAKTPDDRALLLKLWDLAHGRIRPEEAVRYGETLRAQGALERTQLLQLVEDLGEARRYGEALALLRELGPEDPVVAEAMERFVASIPDPGLQVAGYRMLLEARPDDLNLRLRLIDVLDAASQHREALMEYQLLAIQRPDDTTILRGLAQRARWAGDLELAVSTYQRLVALQPVDWDAKRALLDALMASGRHTEAAVIARELVADDPADYDTRLTMAHALAWSEQHEQAIKAYEERLTLGPDDALLRLELGRLYDTLNRSGEAAKQYRAALALDPSNLEAAAELRRAQIALVSEHEPWPTAGYSYFEDSRHVVRWHGIAGFTTKLGKQEEGHLHVGHVTVHDRTNWVNGQWITMGLVRDMQPNWSVTVDQGLAVYDHDHATYRYLLRTDYTPTDRWRLALEHRRDDVWQTPQALEQGISVIDTHIESAFQILPRLDYRASLGYDWYTDSNSAWIFAHELGLRVLDVPHLSLAAGYQFDAFDEVPDPDDIYYAPQSLHTGFGRITLLHQHSGVVRYGGEYIFSFADDNSTGHSIRAHWDYRLAPDVWFQIYARYFVDTARFAEEHYFEREAGANISMRF